MKEIKSTQEFYITEGLYNVHTVNNADKNKIFDLIFTQETIDCYCVECENNSVFKPDDNRPTKKVHGLNSHFPIADSKDWDIDIEKSILLKTKKFFCSRNGDHILIFDILIKDTKLQKIGQFPSIRDLNITEIKGFKKILKDNYFKEYSTAIGLKSHGIGIGSFVYLRRIVENFIIKPAYEEAQNSSGWDEAEFQKKRMKEKIDALKDFLPTYLVQNKLLYSVISKGIHELTEDECNEYFPTVSAIINYILTEMKEKQETEESKKEMMKRLSNIGGKLK